VWACSCARQLSPTSHLAPYLLGTVNARQGRFEDALRHFDACLALHPDFFPALLNHGSVLMVIGRGDRAVASYRAALAVLVRTHGEAVTTPPPNLRPGSVLGWLQRVVMRSFARVPVGNADDPAGVAATLHMYLGHLARVDYAEQHLSLGMELQEFGAFEESLRHIQAGMALQVGK
jgi:tetratricopeptide (TPR) repeat protein